MLQRFGYYETSNCSDARGYRSDHEIDDKEWRSSKNHASWNDALKEAEGLKLINTVEATAAKALPHRLSLHTTTETDAGNLANAGFTPRQRREVTACYLLNPW
jgi:hypothetical protein